MPHGVSELVPAKLQAPCLAHASAIPPPSAPGMEASVRKEAGPLAEACQWRSHRGQSGEAPPSPRGPSHPAAEIPAFVPAAPAALPAPSPAVLRLGRDHASQNPGKTGPRAHGAPGPTSSKQWDGAPTQPHWCLHTFCSRASALQGLRPITCTPDQRAHARTQGDAHSTLRSHTLYWRPCMADI